MSNFTSTTTGIVLNNPATQNPATLVAGAYVTSTTTLHFGDGVYGTPAAAWSFTNLGTIKATGTASAGVDLRAGGTVTNAAGALIAGLVNGVYIGGGAGTVTNSGTINGTASTGGGGVYLKSGGSVSNAGLIAGASGILVSDYSAGYSGAAGTVANSGTILGTGTLTGPHNGHPVDAGINLDAGGVVTNGVSGASTALIDGAIGVFMHYARTETVVNFGTIEGTEAGVHLSSKGSVINGSSGATGALIEGGVFFYVGGTVTNFGTIVGRIFGDVGGAAAVTNYQSIDGNIVFVDSGTLDNLGTVTASGTGAGNPGVFLESGGSITNGASASSGGRIVGAANGIAVAADNGFVTNFGLIEGTGTSGIGVYLSNSTFTNFGTVAVVGSLPNAVIVDSGTFDNRGIVAGNAYGIALGQSIGYGFTHTRSSSVTTTGTVVGAIGIGAAKGITAGYTVTVGGTVMSTVGSSGTAVSLGGLTGRLIVDPGAAFAGTLDGGGGASVLEIAALSGGSGGSGPGRGQGSVAYVSLGSVTNFSALQIDPSATLDGSGALSFATLINEGQVVVGSGDALALGDVAAAANTGVIDLRTGATVDFEGPVANQILAFNPAGGSAKIDQPAEFAGTVADFTASLDTIDLTSLVFAGNTSVGFTPATDALTVVQGGASATLQLDAEDYTGITWSAAPDTGTGTEIAANPCYCRGTLILTEQGEVAVEDLAIGDRVMTLSGMARPVKWIGRRSYDGRFAFGQRHLLPVCVKAGALADGVPRRDLWLSPNHALHLEGVLIEARDLINHVSVFQAERVAAIDYFHIELDSHDVILAEGAAAESFIDDDSRFLFHNAHEYRAIYPDERNGPARYCAPRRDQGYAVERARTRIARRAGLAAAAEVPPPGKLRGQIDEIGRRRISGCAQDAAHPDARSVSTSLPSAT